MSAHAAEQYHLRVRPGLDLDTARAELEQLQLMGQVSTKPPGWVTAAEPARYYLLLGEAVVLPLAPQEQGWVATTCLTKGTLTPTGRARKSARKAARTARKRAERRGTKAV